MAAVLKTDDWFTPEEYLVFEREANAKHEFRDGFVVAMAGESIAHNIIATNFSIELGQALKGSGCRVLNSDSKVRIEEANQFRYPDVSAYCGDIEPYENHMDSYCNPKLIVEVLSDSTEDFDRGDKFAFYRMIESFTEYVLISQAGPEVTVYRKQGDGSWAAEIVTNPVGMVKLQSMKCEIEMAEIYRDVVFDD